VTEEEVGTKSCKKYKQICYFKHSISSLQLQQQEGRTQQGRFFSLSGSGSVVISVKDLEVIENGSLFMFLCVEE
jgi:hypothetical protein